MKLIVYFCNFAKAPKDILMRLELCTVVQHRMYGDTCVQKIVKQDQFVIILCLILFRVTKRAAEIVTDQILYFSCYNDGSK